MNLVEKVKGTNNFSLFINNIGTITAIPKNVATVRQYVPRSLIMAKNMVKEVK